MRAGLDEVVLYAIGSSAHQTVMTDRRPCGAVTMAIVDQWEVAGEVKYHKGEVVFRELSQHSASIILR